MHRIGRTGRIGRNGVAITLAEPREHRQLRNIEAFTRQKIDVMSVPTVADLRSRRLDVMRASLRERLLAGGLLYVQTFARVVPRRGFGPEFYYVGMTALALAFGQVAATLGRLLHFQIPFIVLMLFIALARDPD
mgnify:CR=1 FL=1